MPTNIRWVAILDGVVIGEGASSWDALQDAKKRNDRVPTLECLAYNTDHQEVIFSKGSIKLVKKKPP